MSILRKISVFTMLCVMSILFLAPMYADAATVGDTLTAPETGWQRYDDKVSNLVYAGSGWKQSVSAKHYAGAVTYTTSADGKIKFRFKGSKIRIIFSKDATSTRGMNYINIDGIQQSYSDVSSTWITQVIVYENTTLTDGYHTVIMSNPDGKEFGLDAIDIDETGYLVNYYQPTNVEATPGDTKVTLKWNGIPEGTGYVIHYGTTSGNLTETKTVTGSSITSDVIDKLINGTKYYFTVSSIINGTENTPSTEVSATPTEDTVPSDHAGNSSSLILTMTNGGIKNYDLTINDLDAFLTWYDKKSDGIGKSYYVFNKTISIAPYKSVKEYISFDKISSFEVKEFDQ